MPQRHKETKTHKALCFNIVILVKLRVFEPLWQRKTFRSGFNIDMKNFLFFSLILLSFFSLQGQSKKQGLDDNDRIGEFHGNVNDLCFSPSGKVLVLPELNEICFYDMISKALVTRWKSGHSKLILTVDLSADSTILVSGGLDSTILIRQVQSGDVSSKLDYHHGVITSLHLDSERKLLASGSSDKTVVVYDLQKKAIAFVLKDFNSDITAVRFSPDDQFLAVASMDKTIRLYNSRNGQLIFILEGHKNSVRDLCFNSEGTKLFSCGDDSRVIKWNIREGHQIKNEGVYNFSSDWLLSIDVRNDAYVVAGINSRIDIIMDFGVSQGKIGVPVNKILFVPNMGSVLKFVVATRGKGVYLIDTMNFKTKK